MAPREIFENEKQFLLQNTPKLQNLQILQDLHLVFDLK
jgi:hypothetical protein